MFFSLSARSRRSARSLVVSQRYRRSRGITGYRAERAGERKVRHNCAIMGNEEVRIKEDERCRATHWPWARTMVSRPAKRTIGWHHIIFFHLPSHLETTSTRPSSSSSSLFSSLAARVSSLSSRNQKDTLLLRSSCLFLFLSFSLAIPIHPILARRPVFLRVPITRWYFLRTARHLIAV